MANNEHLYTPEDLKRFQSLSLEEKIQISHTRLLEFYKVNNNKCFISFSGGKDSTCATYLAAQVCELLNCKLILWFSNTGLEFPEVRKFVTDFDKYLKEKFPTIEVETIIESPHYRRGPKKGKRILFKDVLLEHGYPVITKLTAHSLGICQRNPDGITSQRMDPESPLYVGKKSYYSIDKWRYLINAPFKISDYCCYKLKENPSRLFCKENGLFPITGEMAQESLSRRNAWIKYGCNQYDKKIPKSCPLSIWTEQDVLEFLNKYEIPYSPVYGEIKRNDEGELYLTGYKRTGCVFCCFGCHLEKEPNRFQRLKVTHPKLWKYCMKPIDEGGLGLKKVLDYINVKSE